MEAVHANREIANGATCSSDGRFGWENHGKMIISTNFGTTKWEIGGK
jgi:hypothetical protein